MPLSETLIIALGKAVAKFLFKTLFTDAELGQLAGDFAGAGFDWLAKREPTDPIGEAIGQRVKVVYQRSRLPDNDKQATAYEVARTLAVSDTSLPRLVALNLDADALHRQLIAVRPEATAQLSADEEALYKQMLRAAAEGIMETTDQVDGFLRVILGQVLARQTAHSDQIEKIGLDLGPLIEGIARWLREPDDKAKRFQEKYCAHLAQQLDQMEPFGIPARDDIGQRLSLQGAFIGLRVSSRSRRQALIMMRNMFRHGQFRPEQLAALLGWKLDDERLSLLMVFIADATPDEGNVFRELDVEGLENTLPPRAGRLNRPLTLEEIGESWPLLLDKLLHGESISRDTDFKEAFAGERRIMLESKAGAGKSSLLQWLAVRAAEKNFPDRMAEWNGLIPFFIRLRSCRDGEFPAPEAWPMLEAKSIAGSMPDGWVHAQLESGRALVLIDGVDEMPKKQRPALLRELRSLLRNYPLARYVVSSRPTAVNEKEWPEWRDWLRDAGFSEVTLQEMDNQQLDHFVERWHKAYGEYVKSAGGRDDGEAVRRNAGKLKRLLQRRQDLRKLSRTPLLAAMICTLYQERGDHIPRARLELYKECVDMFLERREQRKEVDLAADYIALSKEQKIALLRDLAYWMMDGELSSAEKEAVAGVFERRLPRLNLAQAATGAHVLELFVDRVGLLQEEVVGEISFRHRSFQEFLAADYANYDDKINALVRQASNDQWREVIILSFGLANKKDQSTLLHGILDKARDEETDSLRRQRLLLALACLETGFDVEPELRREVLYAAREVFPPHSAEEAELIAKAGEMAVDLLRYDPGCPTSIAAYSVQALAAIGGDRALEALAGYVPNDDSQVRHALTAGWNSFDHEEYAQKVLAMSPEWAFSQIPTHPHWTEHLAHVEKLVFPVHAGDNLASLASLPQLTSLELSLLGNNHVNLNSLAGLPQLRDLWLVGNAAIDLSFLADLSQLSSLTVVLQDREALDLSPVAGLSQLTSLSLEGYIDDLNPLAGLSQLTSLHLEGNTSADLSPLAALSQLESLSLWSHADDLTPLATLPQLSSLWVSFRGNAAVNLSLLASLTQLTSLSLTFLGGWVYDLSPLANLSRLSSFSLELWDTTVDLSPLAGLSQLETLTLLGLVIADLSPLTSLSQLTSLSLTSRDSKATGLRLLTKLSQLTSLSLRLSLRDNAARILDPLSALTQLTSLSLALQGSSVVDLSPLADLSQLASLSLSLEESEVVDLSPLTNLSQLTSVAVSEHLAQELIALLRPIPRQTSIAIFESSAHFVGRLNRRWLEAVGNKVTYLPAKG